MPASSPSPIAFLRQYARPAPVRERCELCSLDLPEEHDHLVEPAVRRLVCACTACAILFSDSSAGKYRRVPRRKEFLPDFRLTDVQWEGLQLPIELAFFMHSTPIGRIIAMYPSPAGATEALPPPDAWAAIVDDNPVLRKLEPDVEALLANRVGQAREYYRVGIDECYKLVGLIRMHWRGFSGGAEVWNEIAGFFAGLKERARHG